MAVVRPINTSDQLIVHETIELIATHLNTLTEFCERLCERLWILHNSIKIQ